jgi:histidine triad (HIT) family protein
MSKTIFEKLASGEIPCAKVYEDDIAFAFMDAGQVNDGHVVVASKRPAATILDLTAKEAAHLFAVTREVAAAVERAFAPDGLTILQANRPAGWQTVPHFHLHVLPRHANDGVTLGWPRREPGLDRLRELAARITVDAAAVG